MPDGSVAWATLRLVCETTVTTCSDTATTSLVQTPSRAKSQQWVKFGSTSTGKHNVATYMARDRSDCVVSSLEATTMRDAPAEARSLNFIGVAGEFTPRGARLLCSPTAATGEANRVYLAHVAGEGSCYAATRIAAARTWSPTASS